MARISGVDIPKQKRGEIALTYIFGIGKSRAQQILDKAGVDVNKKVSDWNDDEIGRIRDAVSAFTIEGELRSQIQMSIKRLMDIGSFRGIRHRIGLPLRGQRTKNNSRTRKGKRKTVANKKESNQIITDLWRRRVLKKKSCCGVIWRSTCYCFIQQHYYISNQYQR